MSLIIGGRKSGKKLLSYSSPHTCLYSLVSFDSQAPGKVGQKQLGSLVFLYSHGLRWKVTTRKKEEKVQYGINEFWYSVVFPLL